MMGSVPFEGETPKSALPGPLPPHEDTAERHAASRLE